MVNGGRGMRWGQGSMMSGRKIGLIGVIPHVENGGCMEMKGVSDLGQAVGTNVSVGQRVVASGLLVLMSLSSWRLPSHTEE